MHGMCNHYTCMNSMCNHMHGMCKLYLEVPSCITLGLRCTGKNLSSLPGERVTCFEHIGSLTILPPLETRFLVTIGSPAEQLCRSLSSGTVERGEGRRWRCLSVRRATGSLVTRRAFAASAAGCRRRFLARRGARGRRRFLARRGARGPWRAARAWGLEWFTRTRRVFWGRAAPRAARALCRGGREGKERPPALRRAKETGVSRRGGRPLACEKKIGLVSQRWARGDKDAKRRSVLSPGGGQGETNADERRGAFVFFFST